MAIPILYWMLECTTCRTRRVVHDCYLEFVGTDMDEPAEGAGYGGLPLPERYTFLRGCAGPTRPIGSLFSPHDTEMWLHEPHVPQLLDRQQRDEWLSLMREAGLVKRREAGLVKRRWWQVWL